jgi:predicted alpha/beta superfamily hydrolase
MKWITIAFIIVCSCLNLHAQDSATATVSIPGSQLIPFKSSIVGQEYHLYINLPGDYQQSKKEYPVVYLLDAQWDFPLLTALYGEQYYDGYIPGVIIVGITWGGKNPNHDQLRARDLTPTKQGQNQQTGNAPKFISFIKNELVPFIDSKFRTKKGDRTLVGSSLGGLFTTYAFLTETALFNRYVLTSPALGWDNEVIYSYVKDYEEKRSQIPVRIFIGIGEMEAGLLPGFHKWLDHLHEKKYKGVEVQSKILENIGHSGSKAEGYTRGLQFVFERPSLTLTGDDLNKYTGNYQAGNNRITIINENNQLIGMPAGNPKIPLYAETATDFYAKGLFLSMHFKKNNLGQITGFQLDRYGGSMFVDKVE